MFQHHNLVKGNFEKAYFDRKNRYIVVGDSNVELPEQYNEIYRCIRGEKNEECVKERANEKECDVEVEQIANIAIKKSLLDVPSQCVRYIQDIALELLNNQKLSSTDVKQLFSSER